MTSYYSKIECFHITNHTVYAYELLYNIWMARVRNASARKDKDNDNDKRLFEPTDERRRNVT